MSLSERDFQKQVTDLLEANGWLWTHTPDSRRNLGHRGFPDIVAVKPPYTLFIEIKTDKGRLSPFQKRWIDALNAADGAAAVIRPKDWENFKTLIEER